MLFSASLSVALYLFNNEGSWYLQVNLIYSWLCEGSIYVGERIMYLSFSFDMVGLKFKKVRRCVIIHQFKIKYQQFSVI